ncbi:MAG: VOC family protein [ANME-2 cluster archaeon]|nr:VOC family protein [ANME-2 cluster archaeon]
MPTIVHFDIAADDPERAKKFYTKLFGWKIEKPPGPMEYYLIETTALDGEEGIRGGLGKRGAPEQRISNYIGVPSVDEYFAKVEKLGGKIVAPKMTVPGWGYLATCMDTENNLFGLWEEDENAK